MREILVWLLKGAAMGAANVIPGVSGGTIAFVTGIYERLINSLKSIDLTALRLLFQFRIKQLFIHLDIRFLISILIGIAISILSLAKFLEWSFTRHEILTLSFFFGLIVASIFGVGKGIQNYKSFSVIIFFIIGVATAVSIAFFTPASPNDGFLYVSLCGVVAVCSMILPGLSGSYILLLMGNYVLVLQAISAFDFSILIPLGIGCIVGLILFSRVLGYLFSNYKDETVSLLTGFVAGSLLIIWPWKNTEYAQLTEDKLKAVGYDWYLPTINQEFMVSLVLMVAGFLLVWVLEKYGNSAESSNN